MNMLHPSDIGRKPFHLERVEQQEKSALLHVVWCPEHPNESEEAIVAYAYPKRFPGSDQGEYDQVMEALASGCPLHMIGFEEHEGEMLLADARTVWGYVCPCSV